MKHLAATSAILTLAAGECYNYFGIDSWQDKYKDEDDTTPPEDAEFQEDQQGSCPYYGDRFYQRTCGDYDTDSFKANDKCCACGGGVNRSMEICNDMNWEFDDLGV